MYLAIPFRKGGGGGGGGMQVQKCEVYTGDYITALSIVWG